MTWKIAERTGKRPGTAGPIETALVMVGLACLGAGFIAVAAYAAQSGRGDVMQRAAVVATSAPVGLGLVYLGVGGLVVLVMGRTDEG